MMAPVSADEMDIPEKPVELGDRDRHLRFRAILRAPVAAEARARLLP
jgi:hypothetical protein